MSQAESPEHAPEIKHLIDAAVYERYYAGARRAGYAITIGDWAVRAGLITAEQREKRGFDASNVPDFPHIQAIEKVLALEVAVFVFRRLNGPWGEIVDILGAERSRFCNEYRQITGYQIDTANPE